MMGAFPLAINRYYATNSMVYNGNQKNIFKKWNLILSGLLLPNAVRPTNRKSLYTVINSC